MANPWFLTLHIIGIVIYVGGLLNISRMLGYHVKEEKEVRVRLSRMEKRMYFFVNLPGLAIMVVFGLLMLFGIARDGGSGEGVLNYIRPNELVLVLETEADNPEATIYDRAIVKKDGDLDASISQEEVAPGQWLVTYDKRTTNEAGETIVVEGKTTLTSKGKILKQRTPWGAVFHAKLILFLVLLVLDFITMRQILALDRNPEVVPNATRFKILHGLIALVMIAMVILVKTKVLLGGG